MAWRVVVWCGSVQGVRLGLMQFMGTSIYLCSSYLYQMEDNDVPPLLASTTLFLPPQQPQH